MIEAQVCRSVMHSDGSVAATITHRLWLPKTIAYFLTILHTEILRVTWHVQNTASETPLFSSGSYYYHYYWARCAATVVLAHMHVCMY